MTEMRQVRVEGHIPAPRHGDDVAIGALLATKGLTRAGALRARHDIWDAVYVNLSLPLGVGRRGGPEAPPPLPFGTGSIPDPAPPPARFLRVQAKEKAKRDKAKLAKVQEEAFTEAMAGR